MRTRFLVCHTKCGFKMLCRELSNEAQAGEFHSVVFWVPTLRVAILNVAILKPFSSLGSRETS